MPNVDRSSFERMLIELRREKDDLRVVGGGNVDPKGFTLVALLRNEMYFLPEFLDHYRRLGVERFVFLNDRSSDGSLEFLTIQPDTVIVESTRSFGERIDLSMYSSVKGVRDFRMESLWRALLLDTFALDRWALHVDLDEFVRLPEGMTFPDLSEWLNYQPSRMVWGVMLDVYPKDFSALARQETDCRLNFGATWYFDGEEHLRLRENKSPKVCHPGARARLYHTYGMSKLYSKHTLWARLRKTRLGLRTVRTGSLRKALLLRWHRNANLLNPHSVNLMATDNILLPIQHFRFCGTLFERIRAAVGDNNHHEQSLDYRMMSDLLRTMEMRDGSFLYRKSRPLHSFDDLASTGNALGL